MANHTSSVKRIRSNKTKEIRNKYQAKTARNAVRNFLTINNKQEATAALPKLTAMLDKLAKKDVIHKNKASNLKSELAVHVNRIK